MPEIVGINYTPRLNALESVKHQWLWLPLHDGAGSELEDRAGLICLNGAGRSKPILAGAAANLSGTLRGNEWALDQTGLTLQGGVYLGVRGNSELTDFLNLPRLATAQGQLIVNFNFRQVVNPASSQWIVHNFSKSGGFGIFSSKSRRLTFAYQAIGSAMNRILLSPQNGEASLLDGQSHAFCLCMDFGFDPARVTLFVDGTACDTNASVVAHGTLPPSSVETTFALFGSGSGTGLLGDGVERPFATVSNFAIIRCVDRLAAGKIARFVLDQALCPQEFSLALL